MSQVPAIEAPDAFNEINTTPLIDVLLVLLVMFIITIPIQTHAVKFDLSSGPPKVPIHRTSNLLTIDSRGLLRWNGVAIARGDLRLELAAARQMVPAPELHLRPDPAARHGDFDEILGILKREQVSNFGFVGNEAYLNTF